MIKKKLSKIEQDVLDFMIHHGYEGVINLYEMEEILNIPYPVIMECLESLSDKGIISPIFFNQMPSEMEAGGELLSFSDIASEVATIHLN